MGKIAAAAAAAAVAIARMILPISILIDQIVLL